MRNLILTVLHQYHYPLIEPFIRSLKECNHDGDLVIFVSDKTSKTTRKILQRHGAILIPYVDQFPFRNDYGVIFKDISPSITINNYRFLFYLQYLLINPNRYNLVMLTDMRDVIFQQNVFYNLKDDKIYFFLEDKSQTFRGSEFNYQWSVMANGSAMTQQMIDRTVSCAGTIVGGFKPMIDYLLYLQKHFKYRDDLVWGLDQGLHNSYVYFVRPSNAVLVPNTHPYILTLGACSQFSLDNNGLLCNADQHPYRVVHQWDRFGYLLVNIKRKYCGNRVTQIMKKILFKILP